MDPYEKFKYTRVGVSNVIYNEAGKVLTGIRLGSHGSVSRFTGTLQFPGGHIEKGETTFSCARRETKEETGLDVLVDSMLFHPLPRDPSQLRAPPLVSLAAPGAAGPPEYLPLRLDVVARPWEARIVAATNDDFPAEGKHYITLFVRSVLADEAAVPVVLEKEKCSGWKWRSWKEIRDFEGELFAPLVALLRQFGENHEVFKKPDREKDVLL
ncbi:hypothetical protein TD95_002429 [Thielaviopsis punctulata]|uniref:Nudix hydrolase domain-containing protein n=1 Tax=Thielaviopsis punctulata TaxID=72032 RepID=A0A0F4ZCH1_9PEZI|nr:hypothetical protein TD95_002429 [Thielaviopsis punctulata]